MQKYCKQCGAPLTEGANFCRKCGAATGGLESPALGSELLPTTPLDQTQPMTELLNETTKAAPPPRETRLLKTRRSLMLIGGAILLVVVVVAAAFLIGSRWSRTQQILDQEPVAGSEQPTSNVHVNRPPAEKSKPSAPPKKPADDRSKAPNSPATDLAGARFKAEQYVARGNLRLNAGRYQEALADYQQAQRLDRTNRDVYFLMGLAYEKLGELESALEAHQQCTSGIYADQSKRHVKALEKKLRRSK